MSNLEQRCAGRKTQTFTGGKLDLMNAVDFDLRIDPYAARVFRAIIFCLNAETGKCFPSDDWITCAIGGTRKRVVRAGYELRKYGYLDWRKTGRSNLYSFNHAAAVVTLAGGRLRLEKHKEYREMRKRDVSLAGHHDVPWVTH